MESLCGKLCALHAYPRTTNSMFLSAPQIHFNCIIRTRRKKHVVANARLVIDRRSFFDHLLVRQLEAEALEAEAKVGCPVHCVREVYNYTEFEKVLEECEEQNKLVVVDFHDTACGVCKDILTHFIHLCKKGCNESCSVDTRNIQFIKHNIRDQYDELTDLARFYSIQSVPTFSIFLDGCRVQQFSTTNKQYIDRAISQLLH